ENAELAVIENLKWVDRVLWIMAGIGLTVFLAKLMGVDEVEWQNVKVGIFKAWFVVILLTIAHLYVSIMLLKSLKRYWHYSDAQSRQALFDKLGASGGLFVRGLIARTTFKPHYARTRERGKYVFMHSVRYEMDPHDPSAWIALIAYFLLIAALVPFSFN